MYATHDRVHCHWRWQCHFPLFASFAIWINASLPNNAMVWPSHLMPGDNFPFWKFEQGTVGPRWSGHQLSGYLHYPARILQLVYSLFFIHFHFKILLKTKTKFVNFIFISVYISILYSNNNLLHMKSFIAKRVISILVNLRFKLLKYKENNKKICNTFDHNFKNIPLDII